MTIRPKSKTLEDKKFWEFFEQLEKEEPTWPEALKMLSFANSNKLEDKEDESS